MTKIKAYLDLWNVYDRAVSQAHILFCHAFCLQPSLKLSAASSVDYVGNSIRCIARTIRSVALILACGLSSAAQRCMLAEWFNDLCIIWCRLATLCVIDGNLSQPGCSIESAQFADQHTQVAVLHCSRILQSMKTWKIDKCQKLGVGQTVAMLAVVSCSSVCLTWVFTTRDYMWCWHCKDWFASWHSTTSWCCMSMLSWHDVGALPTSRLSCPAA